MPTRYKIQQTSFNNGLQDHLESILELYRVHRSSRRFHQRDKHTCQPREKFWRDKRGATERSEPTSEGGPGGTPRKILKTYIANGAIYVIPELYIVNIISLYCNKTCINYASFITI